LSADNYVIIRKFKNNDFRWAMFFVSDDPQPMPNEKFMKHDSFKTPREAYDDAYDFCEGIIEYGVQFEKGCLEGD
jgi:hypothetical protein